MDLKQCTGGKGCRHGNMDGRKIVKITPATHAVKRVTSPRTERDLSPGPFNIYINGYFPLQLCEINRQGL